MWCGAGRGGVAPVASAQCWRYRARVSSMLTVLPFVASVTTPGPWTNRPQGASNPPPSRLQLPQPVQKTRGERGDGAFSRSCSRWREARGGWCSAARVVCVCGAVPRASRSCFAASGLRGQWMPSTWVLKGLTIGSFGRGWGQRLSVSLGSERHDRFSRVQDITRSQPCQPQEAGVASCGAPKRAPPKTALPNELRRPSAQPPRSAAAITWRSAP